MRVIIVGGGLAGLTLASALEKANIDFLLLEARARLDPQVGASIGLNAAALRILDQLGAAQDIIKHCAPIKLSKVHRSDGSLLMPPAFTFPILTTRFGYGAAFLDRHIVLQVLAGTIAEKEKMLLNKTVLSLDHTDSGVTVNCDDGFSYHGDIVVGCDGVNSKSSVRHQMFRLARKEDPDLFPEKEQMKMTAEYNCLFGISGPVKGLNEGEVDTTFDKGRSILIVTGKGGRVYWFYREKLDKLYRVGDRDFPRYCEADIENLVHKNSWRRVSETVTLGDLWKARVSYTLVPLEEALFNAWSWGRIATVGDNTHKMTPNSGQAGNNAIESAAALANELKKIQDGGLVTSQVIKSALQRWQDRRWPRVQATVKEAAVMCRMQALDSPMASFVMNYVVPNVTESLLTVVTNTVIGAEILEYLPVPRQSLEGTCPFNPNQGTGKHESFRKRAGVAAPFLILSLWAARLASANGMGDWFNQLLDPGQPANSDERVKWLRSLQFLIEGSLVYAIWLIESNRRASALTLAQLPTVFYALSLRFGIGTISPLYYFLHYIFSPIEKFAADDARLTNLAYTRTILPLIMLFLSLPVSLAIAGYSPAIKTCSWRWDWIMKLPFMAAIAQWVLVKVRVSKDSMLEDSLRNQKRDLPYIRWCVYTLSAASGVTWIAAQLLCRSLTFLKPGGVLEANRHGLIVSSLFWVGLLVYDVKKAGMSKTRWATVSTIGVLVAVVAGPLVAVALCWIWREEILASKRERHAITADRYECKSILEVHGSDVSAIGGDKVGKWEAS